MNPKSDANRCPNCSTEILGPFCSVCGQHQVDLDRPLGEIVSEGLSSFVAFDTRIGRTIWPLIRRPGFLTQEFLAGRRARYVHPFKLYFAFSLVFFLVFAFSSYSIIHTNEAGIISINTSGNASRQAAEPPTLGGPQDASISTGSEDWEWINDFVAPLEELAENDPERFDGVFIDRLSKSLIILVPMVALLLQFIYWKPRYVAHLVFSLHLHSFAFLVLVVGAVVDVLAEIMGSTAGGMGNNVATLAMLIYTFLALRRVYAQGRMITTLKLAALILGYVLALALTMLGTLIVTVAFL